MKNLNRRDYSKIFDNALDLIDSAKAIAEIGKFGIAHSLLILSLEELIKYQVVLAATAEQQTFSELEFKKVFLDHKTKHKLLKEFQESLSSDFVEGYTTLVFKSITGQELNQEDQTIKKNRFNSFGSFLSVAYREINLSPEENTAFQDWITQANNSKNLGFYANLDKGKWSFPTDIDQNQFNEAFKYITAIKEQTAVLKDLDKTDDEFLDLLNGSSD